LAETNQNETHLTMFSVNSQYQSHGNQLINLEMKLTGRLVDRHRDITSPLCSPQCTLYKELIKRLLYEPMSSYLLKQL